MHQAYQSVSQYKTEKVSEKNILGLDNFKIIY